MYSPQQTPGNILMNSPPQSSIGISQYSPPQHNVNYPPGKANSLLNVLKMHSNMILNQIFRNYFCPSYFTQLLKEK
jgi:hypothetical protein